MDQIPKKLYLMYGNNQNFVKDTFGYRDMRVESFIKEHRYWRLKVRHNVEFGAIIFVLGASVPIVKAASKIDNFWEFLTKQKKKV